MIIDIGTTIDNISLLIGIPLWIIPTTITLLVILLLIYLTFKAQLSGVSSIAVMIALYTVSMGILSLLNINSDLNVFSLFDGTLGSGVEMVVRYGN